MTDAAASLLEFMFAVLGVNEGSGEETGDEYFKALVFLRVSYSLTNEADVEDVVAGEETVTRI